MVLAQYPGQGGAGPPSALLVEYDRSVPERGIEAVAGFDGAARLFCHSVLDGGIHVQEDVDLAGEVEVERAFGDPGGAGDFFDRGGIEPGLISALAPTDWVAASIRASRVRRERSWARIERRGPDPPSAGGMTDGVVTAGVIAGRTRAGSGPGPASP